MSEQFVRWHFFGPKINRLAQVMRDLGRDPPTNLAIGEFADMVCEIVGPISRGLPPEHFADIALHRIAQ